MSRQNSREISNINVTMNGHEIGIDRVANDTLPFSYVKVLLKRGAVGNGIASIEKTSTSGNIDTYTITYDDGNTDTFTVTNGLYALFEANCSTASDVAAKEVTLDDATYVPQVGDLFIIRLSNGNTAYNPTLNINSTGAKQIKQWGSGAYAGMCPQKCQSIIVKYDGTYYMIVATDAPDFAQRVKNALNIQYGDGTSIDYDGSSSLALYHHHKLITVDASNWSGTVDADGYYRNSISLPVKYNSYHPIYVSISGSTSDTLPTAAQAAAFNLVDMYSFQDSTAADVMVVKAKTKPTDTFYVWVDGDHVDS